MRKGAAVLAALVAPVFAADTAPLSDPSGGFALQGSIAQGGMARGVAPRGTIALSLDGRPVPFDSAGRFILGFDRDSQGRALLVARLPDGRQLSERLTIAPRHWRIEHVDVARRPSRSSDEFLRIRRGELARIAAARALSSAAEGWRQSFAWPAKGRISGRFGSQRVYSGEPASYHSGVDIAAGAGAPVTAPADGVVVLAGPRRFSLEGNLVIVDHGMGLNSAFLHLARIDVREGQSVRRGDPIGTVGASGRATGPHLHWSLMWQRARLDPERVVASY